MSWLLCCSIWRMVRTCCSRGGSLSIWRRSHRSSSASSSSWLGSGGWFVVSWGVGYWSVVRVRVWRCVRMRSMLMLCEMMVASLRAWATSLSWWRSVHSRSMTSLAVSWASSSVGLMRRAVARALSRSMRAMVSNSLWFIVSACCSCVCVCGGWFMVLI